MFEKIKLLEGLKSVDSEDELTVTGHTETLHGVLELDVIEDDGGHVMGVLLGESLVWSGLDLTKELGGVILDGSTDLSAEFSGVVVSLGLREGDSEGHVLVYLFEIGFHGGEEGSLWVLLNLGGLRSGRLVRGNIFLSDGIWSNIWEGRDELHVGWVVSVSSKGRKVGGFSRGVESGNSDSISKEFHYLF